MRLKMLPFIVAVLAALLTPSIASAMPAKVDLCHVDDEGVVRLISVSERAAEQRIAKGDRLAVDGSCEVAPERIAIAVTVLDVVTREPVIATVTIADQTAVTTSAGETVLRVVEADTYDIVITANGYQTFDTFLTNGTFQVTVLLEPAIAN